ncbi:MAG: hypothetical protein HPY59_07390 [Anaerolineae bacterium]|nr:hypothetical protein [Anaerolineae bacterium]
MLLDIHTSITDVTDLTEFAFMEKTVITRAPRRKVTKKDLEFLRAYFGKQRLSTDPKSSGRFFVNPEDADAHYDQLFYLLENKNLSGIDSWIAASLSSDGRRLLWSADKQLKYKRENANPVISRPLADEVLEFTKEKTLTEGIRKLLKIARRKAK